MEGLLTRPDDLLPLAEAVGRDRFRSDDHTLVLAQVAREAVAVLTSAAVHTWSCQRRLLDLSAANVVLRDGETALLAGLRQPALAVLADDPLAGRPGVEVVDEITMFDRLVRGTLGQPLPPGTLPQGEPEQVAALTAIVAAVRQLVRCGDRHLWGSIALAVATTFTRASHVVGEHADRDREAVLSARPDLARTIELVTLHDGCSGAGKCDGIDDGGDADTGDGDPLTFALRRTCCLLYKLPDGLQCATCSLLDQDCRTASLAEWHRAERQQVRASRPEP